MTGREPEVAISVVIPTVGRLEALAGCLRALAQMDHPRDAFEVVVADDEGSGSVAQAVRPWQDELDLTVTSATGRGGAAGARNAGASSARGRWIAFTDDDCAPAPSWLSRLAPALEADPGAAVGGCVVNGARGRLAEGSQAVLDATHSHYSGPEGPRFFATSNLAFPADAFRALGGFDEGFPYAEDRELCERWARSGRRFAYAPDAVVRHMRELTLPQLWRQHFGYGRGAWHYHRVRKERGWGQLEVEPGFYRELGRQVRHRRNGVGPAALAGSALVSQVANAAGFASEALASRTARRSGPSR